MEKTISEIIEELQVNFEKEASKAETIEQEPVAEVKTETTQDEIFEMIKTASSSDEQEMAKTAAAYGRISARAFWDEIQKIATELPAEVIADLPDSAPVSSADLAAAADAVATAASMPEQAITKDEEPMRIQGILATGDPVLIQQKIDELLNSGDGERQQLGQALAARFSARKQMGAE